MKKLIWASLVVLLYFGCATEEDVTYVQIETSMGTMKAELYNETPKHRDNFIKLVEDGYYDDLLFHRVIPNFMIQGGDPDSRGASPGSQLGMGSPGYTIDAEIGQPHFKGALAGARQPDSVNPQKKSNGSQFYIVQGSVSDDNFLNNMESQKGIKYNEAQREIYKTKGGYAPLDMDYTVFGMVVEGLEVIDKIAAVRTDPSNRPFEDVKMKLTIVK